MLTFTANAALLKQALTAATKIRGKLPGVQLSADGEHLTVSGAAPGLSIAVETTIPIDETPSASALVPDSLASVVAKMSGTVTVTVDTVCEIRSKRTHATIPAIPTLHWTSPGDAVGSSGTVEAADLVASLTAVAATTDPKSPKPQLGCVALAASGGELTIAGTDSYAAREDVLVWHGPDFEPVLVPSVAIMGMQSSCEYAEIAVGAGRMSIGIDPARHLVALIDAPPLPIGRIVRAQPQGPVVSLVVDAASLTTAIAAVTATGLKAVDLLPGDGGLTVRGAAFAGEAAGTQCETWIPADDVDGQTPRRHQAHLLTRALSIADRVCVSWRASGRGPSLVVPADTSIQRRVSVMPTNTEAVR